MIDDSLAVRPHYCDPPEILSFEYDPTPPEHEIRPPTIHCDFPPGTRFFCEGCEVVLVSTFIPAGDNGHIGWASRYEWHPETPKQRRKRLGIPFWAVWR
jgi:hypothetical protein